MDEKLNLRISLDLEYHTTIDELRAFMELIQGCPGDRPVFTTEGINDDVPVLHAYIDIDHPEQDDSWQK